MSTFIRALVALVILACLAVAGCTFMGTGYRGEPVKELVILYTAGTGGYISPCGWRGKGDGGFARRATRIKQEREKYEHTLLLDVGDALEYDYALSRLKARSVFEGMNLMRYDAMNVAEREIRYASEFIDSLRDDANFPLISANVILGDELYGEPYTILQVGNLDVGILGLMYTLPDRAHLRTTLFDIEDPFEKAKQMIPELRSKCDILIVLAHMTDKERWDLLDRTSGIDVLIQGKRPRGLDQPIEVQGSKTLIVASGTRGEKLGILRLELSPEKEIINYTGELVALSDEIPSDSTLQAVVDTYQQKLKETRERLRQEAQETIKPPAPQR
jgi:2',3'-cyclic-nucleotide 2'-phosphodiesterase (5'-nucleotidase family)